MLSIHDAVKQGRARDVMQLVSLGHVSERDDRYREPLHVAAASGASGMVMLLLQNRASVESTTGQKDTALHLAARNDHPMTVDVLLTATANAANMRDGKGQTPLMCAAANGFIEVAQALQRGHADLNVRDTDGDTAMHIAARNGRVAMVVWLMDNGAHCDVLNYKKELPVPVDSLIWRRVQKCILEKKAEHLQLRPGSRGANPLGSIAATTSSPRQANPLGSMREASPRTLR